MYKLLVVLLGISVLFACTSTPQTQHYLLQHHGAEALQAYQLPQAKIIVGQVEVAPFLAGAGLVTVAQGSQVHQAHYHRWAEPLSSQLQRQLRTHLEAQLPSIDWLPIQGSAHLRSLDYRLDLVIDEFHLDRDNEVRVSGQWQLRDHEQGYVSHGRFQQREALPADGYPAMVASLEQAWLRASTELAQDLARVLQSQ